MSKFKIQFQDLLPGVQSAAKRLPQIVKGGLATFTLFNDLPYSLGSIIEYNAKKYANNNALLFDGGSYTYKSFNDKINQFAHYFQSIGIKHGDVVIVFLENRPETVLLVGALAKLGAIASLINPNQRQEVLLHSINIGKSDYFIIGAELEAAFVEVQSELDLENAHLLLIEDGKREKVDAPFINLDEAIQSMPTKNPKTTKDVKAKDHLAYIFTSGTTGKPKAAIQTHKQWLRCMNWFGNINVGLKPSDVLYVSVPFYHATAFMIGWSTAFANGATLAMRRKFSTTNFWKDVNQFDVTAFVYIGEICRYLLNAPESIYERDNKVTKVVGNGMRPEIWGKFKERFQIEEVLELYAASDGNVIFTNTFNVDNCVGWSPTEIAIVEYDVEDDEVIYDKNGNLKKVSTGEVGLMLSKITNLFPFAGYANAKNNEKKIFRNVFKQGDAWFNTGDLMRDVGFKHAQFVDRVGDTFRWKGENVSTAELEDVINKFPAVDLAAVYGVSIPNTDGKAGMAAIVVNEPLDYEAFYAYLEKNLPSYAIPIFIRICERLDVTHTQKIKKAGLKNDSYLECGCDDLYYLDKVNQTYAVFNTEKLSAIESGKLVY